MLGQCGDDVVHDVTVRSRATPDVNLGLGVQGAPLASEAGERFRAISATKQWAIIPALGSFGQDIHRCIEPDRDRALVEQLPRPGIDKRATARSNDPYRAVDQPSDEPPLSIAEIALSESLEQFSRANARGFLNFGVAVDERQTQPPGQAAAHGGLACAHKTYEHDRPIKRYGQLFHGPGLYIAAQGRAKAFRQTKSPSGVTMPRGLIFLVVLLLIVIAGIYFLSQSASEVPVQTIESNVTANAATN
jgi:hypothetical protein